MTVFKKHIFVCENIRPAESARPSCGLQNSTVLRSELKRILAEKGLSKSYRVNSAGCLDQCEHGPMLVIYPQEIWYCRVRPEDAAEIVEKTILQDELIDHLVYKK
jgi:(2Fe-2S) ferredoxin